MAVVPLLEQACGAEAKLAELPGRVLALRFETAAVEPFVVLDAHEQPARPGQFLELDRVPPQFVLGGLEAGELVALMGGQIGFESHPGKGTTFRIYLPALQTVAEGLRREAAVLAPAGSETVLLAGEKHLLDFHDLGSVEKLRRLFEAFEQKREILGVLDRCVAAEGVQIFIGQESGYRILDDVSMVTAPYSADNEVVGVIGVIGVVLTPVSNPSRFISPLK